jgi:hypothetical protein
MDVMWMLSQNEHRNIDVSVKLFVALENIDFNSARALYEFALPTLGACAADAVGRRFPPVSG